MFKMIKGQNSVNNLGEVKVLCTFSSDALYLYKIS